MSVKDVMRKRVGAATIILTLLLFPVAALTSSTTSAQEADSKDFTHTVFGELASATW